MTPRKKRYLVATIFAIIAISFALYNVGVNYSYKKSNIWNFDGYQLNSLPDVFSPVSIGGGDEGKWIVKSDDSAPSKPNVLAKLSPANSSASAYHVLGISDSPSVGNARVSVEFKIIAGGTQASAGLVVRLQDSEHYFILMADSVNNRFSFCRAEPGNIICTQDKNVNIPTGQWHTIIADVSAQGVAAYLDDKLLLQRYDQHYQYGQIGLWTKGDSQVYFDDLRIEY